MQNKHILTSPIKTFYYLSFLVGNNNYSSAKKFMESMFIKKIKLSNLTNVVKELIKENYILEIDDGKNNLYAKKEFSINERRFFDDLYESLIEITDKFTYTFKIDGRKMTRKKKFTYDDKCKNFKNDLIENGFRNIIFVLFRDFCIKIISSYKLDSSITRKNHEFNYNNLIKQFILGFSINDDFMEEYDNYLSEDDLFIFSRSNKRNIEKTKEFENFMNVCKEYAIISQINDMSLISKINFIHQD